MSRIKLLLDLIEDVRAVADDLQTIADAMANESRLSRKNPRRSPCRKSRSKRLNPKRRSVWSMSGRYWRQKAVTVTVRRCVSLSQSTAAPSCPTSIRPSMGRC